MYEEEILIVGSDAWRERTLIELVKYRTVTKGNTPILFFLGDGENVTDKLSASDLHIKASRVASHLHNTVSPGSPVVLLFENSIDYLVAFFACLYSGTIPVSGVYPSAIGASERFRFILENSGAKAIIGKRETLQLFYRELNQRAPNLKWIPIESSYKSQSELEPLPTTPESIALIQYTSGSKEMPKGVLLTHRNICHNIHSQLLSFKYENDDIGLSWLPFTHDMGLIGAVLPGFAMGGPFYFMPPNKFIEKPVRWISAISRYNVSIVGGPNFAFRYCARIPKKDFDPNWNLKHWKLAFNGSENISSDTLNEFTEVFEPYGFKSSAFYPCYGLAENTLLVAAGEKGGGTRFKRFSRKHLNEGRAIVASASQTDITLYASCGSPCKDHSVAIMDPDTSEFLPEDYIGEILVSGPSTCKGYVNSPSHNEVLFLEKDGNLFLRTSDFGFIHAGELFVIGRLNERFEMNGNTYYTNDIALSITETARGNVAAIAAPEPPNRPLPTVIVERDDISFDPSLMDHVVSVMTSYHIANFEYYQIRKGFIVRTPSGKIKPDATLENIIKNAVSVVFHKSFIGLTIKKIHETI